MSDDAGASRPARRRRKLTRAEIVERALEISDHEGLDAVSLRRIASELGVTSMALYRHINDKSDLFAAMLDAAMTDVDLSTGIEPGMLWQEQMRVLLRNAAQMLTERPAILPLQVQYQGPLTAAVVGPLERSLSVLLDAGFPPQEAVSLARTVTLLFAGFLLLMAAPVLPPPAEGIDLDLLRRRSELTLLELPDAQYPVLRRHAGLLVSAFLSQGEGQLDQTIDLLVAGLEAKLAR